MQSCVQVQHSAAQEAKPRRPSHGDLRGGEAHDARVARHQLRHPQLGEHDGDNDLGSGRRCPPSYCCRNKLQQPPPSSSPESTTT